MPPQREALQDSAGDVLDIFPTKPVFIHTAAEVAGPVGTGPQRVRP